MSRRDLEWLTKWYLIHFKYSEIICSLDGSEDHMFQGYEDFKKLKRN